MTTSGDGYKEVYGKKYRWEESQIGSIVHTQRAMPHWMQMLQVLSYTLRGIPFQNHWLTMTVPKITTINEVFKGSSTIMHSDRRYQTMTGDKRYHPIGQSTDRSIIL